MWISEFVDAAWLTHFAHMSNSDFVDAAWLTHLVCHTHVDQCLRGCSVVDTLRIIV